jgi:hypothetical protein
MIHTSLGNRTVSYYTLSQVPAFITLETLPFSVKLIGELYHPRILLLGTGMWMEETTSPSGHLSIPEAALAIQWIGATVMIPHHGVEMDPKKCHELIRQVKR